jgi:hypothetical protein
MNDQIAKEYYDKRICLGLIIDTKQTTVAMYTSMINKIIKRLNKISFPTMYPLFRFQSLTLTGNGYHLLDHWNSISKFLEGPLLLSGNRVYSPDTAPSITTRSIWIVTFPNELCHHIKKLEGLSGNNVWGKITQDE